MRKLSTAERRQLVAETVHDESIPIEQRSARALGARHGVSHRTILNDLEVLRLAPVGKPPAGGISKEERQRRLVELYPDHTFAEIAKIVGCSVQPLNSDARELGLAIRRPAPRRKHPEPEARPCECGECSGEMFTPTAQQVAQGYGKFKDWEHYVRAKRAQVEDVAAAALPMWDAGMTLDEIAEARPDITRARADYALRKAGAAKRRPGKQLGRYRIRGRLVMCKARGLDFCPHGDQTRWVFDSQTTEFLSHECWAVYRALVDWHTLVPLIVSRVPLGSDGKRSGDWNNWSVEKKRFWGGRLGALEKGGRPEGALSHWNEGAAGVIAAATVKYLAEYGEKPSFRKLESLTGIPKSTVARLSQ